MTVGATAEKGGGVGGTRHLLMDVLKTHTLLKRAGAKRLSVCSSLTGNL